AVETQVRAEITDGVATVGPHPVTFQAEAETPKVSLGLRAAMDLQNPRTATIAALEVNSDGATVRYADSDGNSAAGRFGGGIVKTSGSVDLATRTLRLGPTVADINGTSFALGKNGEQAAGFIAGLLRAQAGDDQQGVELPAGFQGDFALPAVEIGVNDLVFYRMNAGEREDGNFGNIRASVAVDGYVGTEKEQVITLRSAQLRSNILAADSRGRLDLDAGALVVEYAARVAPAGLAPLLNYLGLPPSLLADAATSGSLAWNGRQLDSKGQAQGRLRLATGEINPFAMVHDLAASLNTEEKSLAVSIRRLDGNVTTESGEAVASLAAQQSNLLLSREGSKGLLDIRVNGAAALTRQLLLGVVGIIPQLRDVTAVLNQTQAEGVYSAWLQLKEQADGTSGLAINVGGVWQGAALSVANVPYLAEAGKLSAALEGDFSHRDSRVRLSKLFLRSDSAMLQADGTAVIGLRTDADDAPNGLGDTSVDLRFVMADLSRLALVFPGVVPGSLGLTGRVDGSLKAGGSPDAIRITEGTAAIRELRLQPLPGVLFGIPNGTASLDATLSLVPEQAAAYAGDPLFRIAKMVNVTGGRTSLTGAYFQDKPIQELSAAFELLDGVLSLPSAQLTIGGDAPGGVQAAGIVDINPPLPTSSLRLAVRNLPLAEINSEIEQFAYFESGVLNLPAQEGAAEVSFSGLTEDEILRTLRLNNFTFATGPVVMYTGPVLNSELDKARALMKMDVKEDDSRRITFQSVTGSVLADGSGVLTIPREGAVHVIGDNTGDFRAWGEVYADRTMDMNVAVVGKLENIVGLTIPNLIPNLRGNAEESNRFMQALNGNAARDHYRLRVQGPFDRPDISGIGGVAAQLMADVFKAAPGQIIGGVVDLGKDAPGALLNAAGALLSAPGEAVRSPETIVNAPGNVVKGIGRAFGIGRRSGSTDEEPEAVEPEEE
ncbi:MAG: AsmA-like C-terminal region-containing protein, partial [Planctomycetes bacterium]|nr:AsmA-like C-terminal region-containing protein [Planctomycetota bacterium]